MSARLRFPPHALPVLSIGRLLSICILLFGCSRKPDKAEHHWFAMDSDFSATVYTNTGSDSKALPGIPGEPLADAPHAFALLKSEGERLEMIFSDYLPGSALKKVQGRAGETLGVEPEILAVFRAAADMAAASHGTFDITLHSLKAAWGLSSGDSARVPSQADLDAAMRGNPAYGTPTDGHPALPPPFAVLEDGRLVLLRDSVVFDLGGIAKGYAVDRMHAMLDSLGYPDHIVKAGGDMRLGGNKGPEPWRLGIRHPRSGTGVAGTLRLEAPTSVSTSGDYERFFMKDGVRYHHVFDPRTGRPARPYSSVTVLAPTSLLADRLTKPLFILGPEAGSELLRRYGAKAVWMRERDGTGTDSSTDGARPPEGGLDTAATRLCFIASEGLEGILTMDPPLEKCP